MGVFTALLGGASVDRFGTRRTLVVLCLATGIFGALRGLAFDFWSLFFFSFLFGMMQPILPMNFFKLNRQWFASGQLGLANGVMSAGFASGLMLGVRASATVLSPLLGGWRAVLILMGACAILLAIVWAILHPPMERDTSRGLHWRQLLANLRYVSRFRELWIFALAAFGVLGLMRGVSGYVPTYLREIGWEAVNADSAVSVFFLASLISVVPITHLSDRLGNRPLVMAFATSMMAIGDLPDVLRRRQLLAGHAGDGDRRLLLRQLHGAKRRFNDRGRWLGNGHDRQRARLCRNAGDCRRIDRTGCRQCAFDLWL